ncbi:MAG: DUF4123 domain-containing protein [Polyangiaceae bacterium]
MLRTQTGPLFAVLDAARDPRVLELLRESVEPHHLLFEGTQGEALAEQAPYLVELPPETRLLDKLVLEGWGKRWGIYLTSPRPLRDVRRHLRRFLMVQDEATGERLYFRFFDPRVLEGFLAESNLRQREQLFSDITAFFAEGDGGSVLRFSPNPGEA